MTAHMLDVVYAAARGPERGLTVEQLTGRVAMSPTGVVGAVRVARDRGWVTVTDAGYVRATAIGAARAAHYVATVAELTRDDAAVDALQSDASYADIAEAVGLSKSAAYGRYAERVGERAELSPMALFLVFIVSMVALTLWVLGSHGSLVDRCVIDQLRQGVAEEQGRPLCEEQWRLWDDREPHEVPTSP